MELHTIQALKEGLDAAGISYREQEPLSAHTTFKIGGPAAVFAQPVQEDQLCGAIALCKELSVPYYVLGNGSNILFGDKGWSGAVICLAKLRGEVHQEGNTLWAPAGMPLNMLCMAALRASLAGLEFAYGIPGTVGGAVYMNAGAYGGEMKDILSSVTVLKENGEEEVILADQLQMGYRTSVIKEKGYVVLEAVLHLEKGDAGQIAGRMEELKRKRVEKQPLEFPSAGSTFKRPEGYFAGKLIMDAGLRGYRVGGASISEKHCGFVVNDQEATARDIRTLMEDVQRIVRERFQVELEPEVKFLGEF